MKLAHISISNYRSIVKLELDILKIITIIGRNNSGKSNILNAVKSFFFSSNKNAMIVDDICSFANSKGTWVECTFTDLSEWEKLDLGKYVLSDLTVCVRRSVECNNGECKSVRRGYTEEPIDEWLQPGYKDYGDMQKWKVLVLYPTYIDG